MSYGPTMVLDKFFGDWSPEEQIGGWFIQGHDINDHYEEKVVIGKWGNEYIPVGWIDWVRSPIKIGSSLLESIPKT